jgi:hypothetical protein
LGFMVQGLGFRVCGVHRGTVGVDVATETLRRVFVGGRSSIAGLALAGLALEETCFWFGV